MAYPPSEPVDIYTVQIFFPQTRPGLLNTLRGAVNSGGGKFIFDLVEGRGFMFSVPVDAPSPVTTFVHARWLEEGSIQISKTPREQPDPDRHTDEAWLHDTSGDDADIEDSSQEDFLASEGETEHPNLRKQWTWTELRR